MWLLGGFLTKRWKLTIDSIDSSHETSGQTGSQWPASCSNSPTRSFKELLAKATLGIGLAPVTTVSKLTWIASLKAAKIYLKSITLVSICFYVHLFSWYNGQSFFRAPNLPETRSFLFCLAEIGVTTQSAKFSDHRECEGKPVPHFSARWFTHVGQAAAMLHHNTLKSHMMTHQVSYHMIKTYWRTNIFDQGKGFKLWRMFWRGRNLEDWAQVT